MTRAWSHGCGHRQTDGAEARAGYGNVADFDASLTVVRGFDGLRASVADDSGNADVAWGNGEGNDRRVRVRCGGINAHAAGRPE